MVVYDDIRYTGLLFSDFAGIDDFFEEPVYYEAPIPMVCTDSEDKPSKSESD